jgi:hypothetical protein
VYLAPALRFAPLLSRRVFLMYTTFTLYIRNTMPAGAPLPRRRSWAVCAGAMLNFAFTEFSEV